jgi:hypothetical protein
MRFTVSRLLLESTNACRVAMGEALESVVGGKVKLKAPLD